MNDEYFMQQALKEARIAYEEDEVPIGAVVVMAGRIIALTSAFNHLGSKYLPEAAIYVTVEPCLMCAGALYWSKIGRVVFGAEDEKNGYRRGLGETPAPWPFHPKTELIRGVLSDDCIALMRDFFRSKR